MIEPGFYPDLDEIDYHADPAMSSGKLKWLQRSPAHYKASFHGGGTTKEMTFGGAFHIAALEPDYSCRIVPQPTVTPAERDFADSKGYRLITNQEDQTINDMLESLWAHETASKLIGRAKHHEASIFWRDATYDFMCKCKPDLMIPDLGILVDLKTASDASSQEFSRASARYGYDVQAGWYLTGANAICGPAVYKYFVFIVIEKTPPFGVAVYNADREGFIEPGRKKIKTLIDIYAQCLEKNDWPSYSNTIQDLELPGWAKGG